MDKIKEKLSAIITTLTAVKDRIKENWKPIVVIVLLLGGVAVSVVLVQRAQILKSGATAEINEVLDVTAGDNGKVEYKGNNTYETDTLNIKIGIKDPQQFK